MDIYWIVSLSYHLVQVDLVKHQHIQQKMQMISSHLLLLLIAIGSSLAVSKELCGVQLSAKGWKHRWHIRISWLRYRAVLFFSPKPSFIISNWFSLSDSCPDVCGEIEAPVCGSDDVIYANECILQTVADSDNIFIGDDDNICSQNSRLPAPLPFLLQQSTGVIAPNAKELKKRCGTLLRADIDKTKSKPRPGNTNTGYVATY